jgi:3D-(3,5/4)-trihydroxycyclohexane-1,2-dione acylhydrolase (decyclizing)
VLLLPGDVFASRKPGPVLQELEDPASRNVSVNDCLRPVSRYWDRINRPEQLLTALPDAMRVLADPAETGAVTLALPEDVQAEAFDCPVNFFERRVYENLRVTPPGGAIRSAAKLIRGAKLPIVIAGGGVPYSEAEAGLQRFAEALNIPVAVTQAGKGSLLESHPLCLGAVGVTGTLAANRIAAEADVVIAIGTRLSDFTTGSKTLFQNPRVRFININVNSLDAHKHGGLPLVGDARAGLAALVRAAAHAGPSRGVSGRTRLIARARGDWRKEWALMTSPRRRGRDGLLYQSEVIRILNSSVGPNSTVVHASGGIPGDIHKLWECGSATQYHSEYGYSCMGYEIAGAVGVKLAAPEREVYTLLGDGSYLMLNHEIVTAVQEGLKITVVLTDNHGFGCIQDLQRACGGRPFGNEFRRRAGPRGRLVGEPIPVDYAANARSLGARAFTAGNERELVEALAAARESPEVCVIYVPVTPASVMRGYAWWEVPPAEISGVPGVRSARRAYLTAKRNQRFYY